MPSIGKRCHELRVRDAGQSWRVIYRTDPDAVLVVSSFSKKTNKMPKAVIVQARKLLREVRRGLTMDWRPLMSVSRKKKAKVEAMGGQVTSVEEWLELTPEDVAVIDMKIRLGESLRDRRRRKRLSQEGVAKILQTSQGRVSKLERGQATLDQLTRSLLALGGSAKEVARAISG